MVMKVEKRFYSFWQTNNLEPSLETWVRFRREVDNDKRTDYD
jgi:hypothetical protein